MSNSGENVAISHYDQFGRPVYTLAPIPVDKDSRVKIYKMPDRIIPVIFLPGVMGSNLKSEGGKSIWKVDGAWSMKSWITKGPEDRKKLLDPTRTIVDPSGEIETESQEERTLFLSRRERGWGEVGAMSYGTFLPWLQKALNDNRDMVNNKATQNGKKTLREELMEMSLHAELGENPLTSDEVSLSYKYLFPVHAVGYNWLQSNVDSAKALSARVDKIISGYKASGRKCEKVILVTHSMGGLVARHYSEILTGNNGDKKILGIVHGVMPDLGSPMAYKRMKTGEAGTTGWVIGSDGADMTAVLAQSPGPLQLLPGMGYGMEWLQIDGVEKRLPQADPYTEIYTRRSAWWALCEERFINPENGQNEKTQRENDWFSYKDIINGEVKIFIEGLYGHYHENTYSFYGNDGVKYPSYETLHWQDISSKKTTVLYKEKISYEGEIFYPADTHNQIIRVAGIIIEGEGNVYRKFELSPPKDPGDGTVPVNAAIIRSPNLKAQLGLGVDHEGAYKADNTMDSRWFTLRSIIKIAQLVNDTGLAYDK